MREQRERFLQAMAEAGSERGYRATRVGDVIAAAGLSRNTFYRHFSSIEDCYLAALEDVVGRTETTVRAACAAADPSAEEQFRTAVDALARVAAAEPAACRLWLVEGQAPDPAPPAQLDRVQALMEHLASAALAERAAGQEMPAVVVTAIVGGLQLVAHRRLRAGREEELPRIASELAAWALDYRPPSARLDSAGSRPASPPEGEDGWRDARARIVDAVTEAVAAKGFAAATMEEIARRAEISYTTFYAHFKDLDDAFRAAIDHHEAQLVQVTLAAYQQAPDWPHAVSAGLRAFFGFLAANPDAATIGGYEIYAAGASMLDRREATVAAFEALLADGYRLRPDARPISSEAIGAAIASLFYETLRRGEAERLDELAPVTTYLALAPFVSAAEASELATRAG